MNHRHIASLCLALSLLLTQGCLDTTIREYEPVNLVLDENNELQVSTYPSWYPRETFSIPFLYKALETPDLVYFQFFVREKGKNGPNRHIEEIMVHEFSYKFPSLEPVVFLKDYPSNFWMQNNPRYDQMELPAVRHSEGWYLTISADLTVNGERYQVEETMAAIERRSLQPLILYVLQ